MLSVQKCGTVEQNVSFSAKKTNEKAPYRQHSGLKTGGVAYTIPAATTLAVFGFNKSIAKWGKKALKDGAQELGEEGVKNLKTYLKDLDGLVKASGKKMFITIPLGYAVCMACGALIDKLSNNKRAKLEADLTQKDQKEVLKENKRAEVTRSGGVYYKSNEGKKYGALLGMAVLPAWKYAGNLISQSKTPVGVISSAIMGAIGGFVLGSITDKHSNKAAKKLAEKAAQ